MLLRNYQRLKQTLPIWRYGVQKLNYQRSKLPILKVTNIEVYLYIWYSLQDLEFSRNASTFSTNLKNTTIFIIRINNNMFQIVTIVKQIWNCLQTIVQSKWLSVISKEKQNRVLNKNMAIFRSFWVHKKMKLTKKLF
jgi:hypothetical protein